VRQKLFRDQWYIRHKPCTYLAVEPCQLEVPLVVSTTIYEPTVRLMHTMHLSYTDTNNISKRTETRSHMTHVTYDFHRVRLKLFLSLWYDRANRALILRQDWNINQTDRNELPIEPHNLRVPSASKIISEPMVRLAQTLHLSYTYTNTVSKWTKMRFQMTHIT
jgi:hypothetical protein